MKILTKVSRPAVKYVLAKCRSAASCAKIHLLVRNGSYRRAIREVLDSAETREEVPASQKSSVKADLIITETNAHWDLTV